MSPYHDPPSPPLLLPTALPGPDDVVGCAFPLPTAFPQKLVNQLWIELRSAGSAHALSHTPEVPVMNGARSGLRQKQLLYVLASAGSTAGGTHPPLTSNKRPQFARQLGSACTGKSVVSIPKG